MSGQVLIVVGHAQEGFFRVRQKLIDLVGQQISKVFKLFPVHSICFAFFNFLALLQASPYTTCPNCLQKHKRTSTFQQYSRIVLTDGTPCHATCIRTAQMNLQGLSMLSSLLPAEIASRVTTFSRFLTSRFEVTVGDNSFALQGGTAGPRFMFFRAGFFHKIRLGCSACPCRQFTGQAPRTLPNSTHAPDLFDDVRRRGPFQVRKNDHVTTPGADDIPPRQLSAFQSRP